MKQRVALTCYKKYVYVLEDNMDSKAGGDDNLMYKTLEVQRQMVNQGT